MIQVKNMSKKYGKLLAVDRINLIAQPGKITVLLGPNGAGKSTTIKSIAGLLKFDGEIYVNGFENKRLEAKRTFGYVPEMPVLYDALTVKEHLRFVCKAYRLEEDEARMNELLSKYDMLENQNKVAKELSKGMMQKLSFLCALIINPQALLVDEPLLGLDPNAIENMLEGFVELKNQGTSLLLSTHIIDMIEDIWDEAYIMHHGKIINHVQKEDMNGQTLKALFFESVGNSQ